MVFVRDLGITLHNFHKIYKVSGKKFFVSVLIYFQIDPITGLN